MKKNIITISREFGSGGRTVGRKLAERLNIPFYDGEIIEKVHEETGFSQDFIKEQCEHSPTKSIFSYAFVGRDVNGISINDYVWNAQRKIILDLAEKGPCVIVGRCADFILRDRDDCFNVFIHADEKFKAERIVKEYGETDKSPEKRLREKDKKRKINYKYYTDQDWGVCDNYDISLNTGTLGIDKCVDIIEELVK